MGGVCDDQVECVASGVGGDINKLVEVEALQKLLELSCRVRGRGVDVDVKVSHDYNVCRGSAGSSEQVMYLWNEGWVWFGGPVNEEYGQGGGGSRFESKTFEGKTFK